MGSRFFSCTNEKHNVPRGRILIIKGKEVFMPLFRITVKQSKVSNGVRLEKGMSVDVVSNSFSNPVSTNGGQPVIDAFNRIYGVDIKKAGALSMVYLDVENLK